MRDYLPLDDPFFIVLLLIFFGFTIRFFVHRFFDFLDKKIEMRGKQPTKGYLFFEKCCMILVNWVIPFILFTFVILLLGD